MEDYYCSLGLIAKELKIIFKLFLYAISLVIIFVTLTKIIVNLYLFFLIKCTTYVA